jgi:hypothetical protein
MTLEAPSDSSVACVSSACRVHLVQGTGPELSGETENLLRSRLRSAALLLFAGFASFLVYHIAQLELVSFWNVVLLIDHCLTTLVLGLIGMALCKRCPMSTRQLRWIELITFGVPTVFFVLLEYNKTMVWTADHSLLPDVSTKWLLQIFVYALFIPNTWRRAAVIVGLMAATPVVTLVVTSAIEPAVRGLMWENPRVLVETLLVMSLAAVTAVLGVWTINSLRTEAYRAKQLGQY